jgi:hypothetical protein
MNYYNEHIRASVISSQVLLGNSAFDQEARGMSDKAPRPYRAIYNFVCYATGYFFHGRACAPNPTREFHRRTRTPLVLVDYACENEAGLSLGAALIWFFDDKPIHVLDFLNAIRALFLRFLICGIHRSIAISGFVQDQSGMFFRTFYKRGLLFLGATNPDTSSHIRGSSIKSVVRAWKWFYREATCKTNI